MKNPRLTLKEALDLSILKWQAIVDNGGYDETDNEIAVYVTDTIPEIQSLAHQCGMCEYMKQSLQEQDIVFSAFDNCQDCILYPEACGKDNSWYELHDDAVCSDEKTVAEQFSKAILKRLKDLRSEQDEKH